LDTPHSPDEFPTRPYLIKNERVRFQVQSTSNNNNNNNSSDNPKSKMKQSEVAIHVRFENGRQIPLYRKNYHASVVKGELQRLGQAVYDILSSNDDNDEVVSSQQRYQKIMEAKNYAQEQIDLAAEKQGHYGPELDGDHR
jgi:hypothetical protein